MPLICYMYEAPQTSAPHLPPAVGRVKRQHIGRRRLMAREGGGVPLRCQEEAAREREEGGQARGTAGDDVTQGVRLEAARVRGRGG